MNFQVIESINFRGARVYTVRNNSNGKELGTFRFYEDACKRAEWLQSLWLHKEAA